MSSKFSVVTVFEARTKGMGKLSKASRAVAESWSSLERSSKDVNVNLAKTRGLMAKVNAEAKKVKNSLKPAKEAIKKAKDETTKLKNGLGDAASESSKLGKKIKNALKTASIIQAVRMFKNFVVSLIDSRIELENISAAMTAATGSADLAAESYAFVRAESDRLGISLPKSAREFSKLAAAAKNSALEGAGVREIFSGAAEAVTTLRLSSDDAAGVFRALSQVISKGKVQAEELRLQLGDRIPGAVRIMAQALNVTTKELDTMLAQGKVGVEALVPFIRELKDEVAAGLGGAVTGTQAKFARLQNTLFEVKNEIASGLIDQVGDLAQSLNEMLSQDNRSFVVMIQGVGAQIGYLISVVGNLIEFLGTLRKMGSDAFLKMSLAAATGAQLVSRVFLKSIGTIVDAFKKLLTFISSAIGPNALRALGLDGIFSVEKINESIGSISRSLSALTEKSDDTADIWIESFKDMIKESDQMVKKTKDLSGAVESDYVPAIESAEISSKEFKDSIKGISREVQDLRREIGNGPIILDFEIPEVEFEFASQLEGFFLPGGAFVDLSEFIPATEASEFAQAMFEAAEFTETVNGQVRLIKPEIVKAAEEQEKVNELASKYVVTTAEAKSLLASMENFEGPLTQENIDIMVEAVKRWSELNKEAAAIDAALSGAENKTENWADALVAVSGIFSEINSELGNVIKSIASAVISFRALNKAKAAGGGGLGSSESIAAGASTAGLIGGLTGGFGSQETTQFGGLGKGNFAQEGAQLGSLFGPVGAAVGFFLGAFFEKSADQAQIILEDLDAKAGGAVGVIKRADGGLGEIAQSVSESITGFVSGVESLTGGVISELAGLKVTIEGDLVTVEVAGAIAGFTDLGSALGFAAERLLMANKEVDGFGNVVGENVTRLVEDLTGPRIRGSFEDLQRGIEAAVLFDRASSGENVIESIVPDGLQEEISNINQTLTDFIDISRQYNLSLEDGLVVLDQMIQSTKDNVDAQRLALLGSRDSASELTSLLSSMQAVNDTIVQQESTRLKLSEDASKRAIDLEQKVAEAREEIGERTLQTTGEVVQTLSRGLAQVREDLASGERISGGSGAEGRLGTTVTGQASAAGEAFADSFGAAVRDSLEDTFDLSELERELGIAREEADALAESVANISEEFSQAQFAEAANASALQAGKTLLGLIENIVGAETVAAEMRITENELMALQLAANIASVETLLASTDLFSDATSQLLDSILDKARGALAAIQSGEIDVTRPRRPSGSRRAEREREESEQERLREQLAALEEQAFGASGAVNDVVKGFEDVQELAAQLSGTGESARALAAGLAIAQEAISGMLLGADLGGLGELSAQISQQLAGDLPDAMRELLENLQATIPELARLAARDLVADSRGDIRSAVDRGDVEAVRDIGRRIQEQIDALPEELQPGLEEFSEEFRRRLEVAIRRAQAVEIENLTSEVADFSPPPEAVSRFDAFRDAVAAAQTAIDESNIGIRRRTRLQAELDAQIESGMAALRRQLAGDLLGAIETLAAKWGVVIKDQQLLAGLRKLQFQTEIINIQILINLAIEMGLITQAVADGMGVVLADIIAAAEGFDFQVPVITGSGSGAGSGSVGGAGDPLADARRFLESLEDRLRGTLDPMAALNAEMDAMIQEAISMASAWPQLGTTLEDVLASIEDLRAAEIDRLFEAATQGLRNLLEELTTGAQSLLPLQQQFQETQANVADLAQRALNGDLEAAELLGPAIQQALDVAMRFLGPGEAFAQFQASMIGLINDVLGIIPPETQDPGIPGGPKEDQELLAAAFDPVFDITLSREERDQRYKEEATTRDDQKVNASEDTADAVTTTGEQTVLAIEELNASVQELVALNTGSGATTF